MNVCRGNLGRAENGQHWTGGLEGEHIHIAGPFQGGMGMGRALAGRVVRSHQCSSARRCRNPRLKFTPNLSHHCEVTFVNKLWKA